MIKSSVVVIDAGVGVLQVVADPRSDQVDQLWANWIQDGFRVCAPRLWLIEATSVLHKIFKQNLVSEEKALRALDALLELGVDLYEADADTCRRASAWATKLDQYQAYNGFYLALAEQMQASFWTTDKRLVNHARQLGITWLYWIGE